MWEEEMFICFIYWFWDISPSTHSSWISFVRPTTLNDVLILRKLQKNQHCSVLPQYLFSCYSHATLPNLPIECVHLIYSTILFPYSAISDNATLSCCHGVTSPSLAQWHAKLPLFKQCSDISTRGSLLSVTHTLTPPVATHTHSLYSLPHTVLLKHTPTEQGPGWIAIWRCRALAADVLTLVNEPSAPPNLSL